MALTRVCAGYIDKDGNRVPCDKDSLGTRDSDREGVTHGMCPDCYQKHMAAQVPGWEIRQ